LPLLKFQPSYMGNWGTTCCFS